MNTDATTHRFLAEASAVLASSIDYRTTVATVARLAVPFLADWSVVDLREADGRISRVAVAQAEPEDLELQRMMYHYVPLPELRRGVWRVMETGRAEMIREVDESALANTARDTEHLAFMQALNIRSYLCVPLLARGQTLGTLMLFSSRPERLYDDSDLALAEDLACRAAFAVDNARLFLRAEQLRKSAEALAVDNARLYQQSAEASRSKDDFIATVSHELRTPLTSLLLWAERLGSGRLDETQRRRGLDAILSAARAQRRLIEDLLDVSGIVAGKLQMVMGETSLPPLLRGALDEVTLAAELKRVRLSCTVDPAIDRLFCDAGRIRQVLVNLLGNAIKFTPEGGEVMLEARHLGSQVELRVRDTGAGIPPDLLPHVFERFRQGSEASLHGGLGLGLAIVKHIVDRHDGTVLAMSLGPGTGAQIVVTLPAPIAPSFTPAPAIEVVEAPPLAGLRVLLVDDDANIRELFADALLCSGADVVTAAGAVQAMAEIEAQRPDVIVSDLSMPGEDGYSLIRRVRAHPQARHVPAAAVSASATLEHRRRALDAGYQAHVVKPVELAALIQLVADLGSTRTLPRS